jgi:hypothetical protein
MSWILLFAFIGLAVVVVSYIIGNNLTVDGVVYDIGIAIVTLALVDLILLRSLKEFASRPTEQEKRMASAIASANTAFAAATNEINQLRKFTQEVQQNLEYFQLNNIEDRVVELDSKLDEHYKEISEGLSKIRERVDSVYKEVWRGNEKHADDDDDSDDDKD